MTNRRQAMGRWGEEAAALFLEKNGYALLDRNVRYAHGEIDIVAFKGGVIVFVEVKTRRSHNFAFPEESVTLHKQAHLRSAVEEYLQAHPSAGENWQVDVLSVEGSPGADARIDHFENVME
jgi:putative endonuclease